MPVDWRRPPLLQIHYKTLLKHIRGGELRATKRGNRLFIRRSWVDEVLAPIHLGPGEPLPGAADDVVYGDSGAP